MTTTLTDSQITEGLRLAGEAECSQFNAGDFLEDGWSTDIAVLLAHAGTHYAAALAEVQALRGQVRALQAHNSGSDNTAKRYVGPADTEASR